MTDHGYDVEQDGIAVVGMSGRFPGANDIDRLWANLRNGVESIQLLSPEELDTVPPMVEVVQDPCYVRAAGILTNVEDFDAAFFGFTPREAEVADPQHRIFLECAYEALEHAACDAATFDGRIGVYAGAGQNSYFLWHLFANPALYRRGMPHAAFVSDKDLLAGRVSYALNLRGPSINVGTTCSTSLVAVHLACQALLSFQCDAAIAGGVQIRVPQKAGHLYNEGGAFSPDGHCRAFDARAAGTVGGNGAGVVVLKRLPDALAARDEIYAIIRGSAVNNDGADKVGFVAPSPRAQADVIQEALAISGVGPDTIGYVEAHGTGTRIGDAIEVAALKEVFSTAAVRQQSCALGSVKTNLGHLDAAAGVVGLIKAILALYHREIPPTLHFKQANPELGLSGSPFYVNTSLTSWVPTEHPRRAGVSAFGVGGTNAHVVLEEAPSHSSTGSSRPTQLLVLSAKTPSALLVASDRLLSHLEQNPDQSLADIAYTLQVGRQALAHRRVLVCRDTIGAMEELRQRGGPTWSWSHVNQTSARTVFLFPGRSAQYPAMTKDIYETEPVYRHHVDECAEILKERLGHDLRHHILSRTAVSSDAELDWAISQGALFAVEYSLARLWMSWGVNPSAMLGHSSGEVVAACLAGVLTLKDALHIATAQAQAAETLTCGAMLAVALGARALDERLRGTAVDLAAINAPNACVVSGPEDAVAALERELAEDRIAYRRLPVTQAVHSAMIDPVADRVNQEVGFLPRGTPRIPYVSCVTGTWITSAELQDPDYWGKHLRRTVRFADGVSTICRDLDCVFLEVGPGTTLRSFVKQTPSAVAHPVISSTRDATDARSDDAVLAEVVGRLWLAGVTIDWRSRAAPEHRRKVALPTYPFERQRYWVDRPNNREFEVYRKGEAPSAAPIIPTHPVPAPAGTTLDSEVASPADVGGARTEWDEAEARADLTRSVTELLSTLWVELLGADYVEPNDSFFDLGGNSLVALHLHSRIRATYQIDFPPHVLFDHPTLFGQAQAVSAILFAHLDSLADARASDTAQ